MPGLCEELDAGEEEGVDRVRDRERRDEGRQRLAQQELLAADRRREHRLERALLALADHGVGGERCGHERRDGEHVQQLMLVGETVRMPRRPRVKTVTSGWMRKMSGKIDHRGDDGAVAPVLAELLAEDGPDAPPADAHLRRASSSSSISSR